MELRKKEKKEYDRLIYPSFLSQLDAEITANESFTTPVIPWITAAPGLLDLKTDMDGDGGLHCTDRSILHAYGKCALCFILPYMRDPHEIL